MFEKKPRPEIGRIESRLTEYLRETKRRDLLNPKGEPNLVAISRGTGIPDKTLFYLLRRFGEKESLNLEVLARVCSFVGCQPGDILEFVPDTAHPVDTPIMDEYSKFHDFG